MKIERKKALQIAKEIALLDAEYENCCSMGCLLSTRTIARTAYEEFCRALRVVGLDGLTAAGMNGARYVYAFDVDAASAD